MQFIVTYTDGMYTWLSKISPEISVFNFGHLSSGHYIYMCKDVRIHGYFSKPKRVREQQCLGNIALI